MKTITSFFLFFVLIANAQTNKDSISYTSTKYLEDQFFVSLTYNLLTNKPEGIKLRGFSNTVRIGYIRDFPLNTKRNIGLGLGLAYARTSYFHNMEIIIEENKTFIKDFDDVDIFDSNKLVYQSIDLPIEFRIRNATLEKNKFFRAYVGINFSYIFRHKSQFNLNNEQKKYTNFDYFNTIQYGITSSIGYGTWNAYFYYGLSNLFKDVKFNNEEPINTKSLQFGLIFYIL